MTAMPVADSASRKEEALWLLDTMVPGSPANHLSLAFRVEGRLDPEALRHCLDLLVRRHEALRTAFVAAGPALRRVVLPPEAAAIPFEQGSITAEAELTAFVARPFVLAGRPPLRAGLFHIGAADVCCLAVHHLIFDTRSAATLLRELTELYGAVAAGRRPPAELTDPVPAHREPPPRQESLDYWRDRLDGFDPAALALRCGVPDVAEPTLAGDQITRPLSQAAAAAVRRAQRELRAPESVVLLAGFLLLLAAHGAGPDLAVGSPVDVRPAGVGGAVGYHVNVLPLRVRVDPAMTVRELVRATRDGYFDALVHADVPVDRLTAELPRTEGTWHNPLVRHLFNYVPGLDLDGFTVAGLPARPLVVENGASKFDLELFVLPAPGGIRIRAVFGTEFLSRADAEALLARYDALLAAFDADAERPVGALRVWSPHDSAVIAAANDTDRPAPGTVLEPIRDRCRRTPAAPAVVEGDTVMSYRELWSAACTVRRDLTAAGVGPGQVVALAAPRSAALAAAVLGTWLAGAAYLPLDPEHPAARIAFQLEDSGARAVLAAPGVEVPPAPGRVVLPLDPASGGGPEPEPDRDADEGAEPDPDGLAYLIYTSGSTGTPKGTLIAHRSLANLVAHFRDELRVEPRDATLWLTTFTFDISGLELLLPLAAGGRVVIAPDLARVDGRVLRDLLVRHEVDIVQATPTTWRLVLDEAGPVLRGRRVLCGGEPTPPPLARRLLETGCLAQHVYGPTETTIWSTAGPLRPGIDRPLDAGRPIADTRLAVVDPAGRALPIGVRGELWIGGAGVAIGYHARPPLTAERFGRDPELGRYYRTGDEARWREDGTIELLGRADRQVKLRGNRVELGEIEAAVLSHPRVRAAAVVVAGELDDAALVAFAVPAGEPFAQPGRELDRELWQHCRDRLPRALVPQLFVLVEALPANTSAKIDYPALTRDAAVARQAVGRDAPAGPSADQPADELVADLVEQWRAVLGTDAADADTHFFTGGGTSLSAALLVQRIERELGVDVRLADVFAQPTPARLAALIRC